MSAIRREEQCSGCGEDLQQVAVSFDPLTTIWSAKLGKSEEADVGRQCRYERISCAQKMSFVNGQVKQQTDWAAVAKNPKLVRTRFPRWIYQHDPEAYAYEKFGLAFHHVVSGGVVEFQNTNFPPGHKFRKWTIEEVKAEIKEGKRVEALLDGDWT